MISLTRGGKSVIIIKQQTKLMLYVNWKTAYLIRNRIINIIMILVFVVLYSLKITLSTLDEKGKMFFTTIYDTLFLTLMILVCSSVLNVCIIILIFAFISIFIVIVCINNNNLNLFFLFFFFSCFRYFKSWNKRNNCRTK